MLTASLIAGACLIVPSLAAGQSTPEVLGPYDGSNPFRCELQYAGTGTDFSDPAADPFCVEYDKTNQNVTGFGIAEFNSQEPARVAAATPKCFYFQRDHWTGWVVQGSHPELYHWDGSYFFDRARGVGGVSVVNFRVGGVPLSPSPYVPPAYAQYFSPTGGGGVLLELESRPDPGCAARVDTPEERARIYAGAAKEKRCIEPGGRPRGRRLGGVRLGMRRDRVLNRLGAPRSFKRGVDGWCLIGKGHLRVSYRGRAGAAELIRSSGPGHSTRGVARGDRARRAHRRLDLDRLFKIGAARVFEASATPSRTQLLGVASHRVRWVAIADPAALRSRRALRRALAASR